MKNQSISDQQLIAMFQHSRSADSFGKLYQRYAGKVFRTCLSVTHDPIVAEDFTHDIFLRVFSKLDSFQNRSSFSTWLYSIAYNYCLDRRREGRRLGAILLTSHAITDHERLEISDEANLHEYAEYQLTVQEQALAGLPADELSLLQLKYMHGLSVQSLSQQLNLSESAVKMRLKRSRDKLRDQLKGL